MKTTWPKVRISHTLKFYAEHSLPEIGVAERHGHEFTLTAGWLHEINPYHGCTKPMQDIRKDLAEVVVLLDSKYLNDVFRHPPTAETMACWIMARLPEYWDFVRIEAYDGFSAEVQAGVMRSEWLAEYRK
ncbi:COG0720 6-pyruvoyl-tetrahydropterin synthase [uncultured Caudovirales phage]|uniref:COG0720 6-pyruvoyl-tetrahydropterin synthase n=1 Tax=uncultured Caudovirales phage TaxID=2100421 RepID=A0A6J5KJE9_9CAUD|nr:COG0720 6-pyruvoyl-tetrahydropterin synthase [uncultured Caudovirales phage]CAB5170966.1 COG0720 6-pyruvoyl-tetrahydropterin synthase [uncultured Caudovirales phage]